MVKKINSWSYSRLSLFETCRRKFKRKVIDKAEDSSYAMSRGKKIEEKINGFIMGQIKRLPTDLKLFKDVLNNLRDLHKQMKLELQHDLTITRSYSPTDGKDWTGAWCRAYADYTIEDEEFTIVDAKTGGIYEKNHEDQGRVMAMCGFVHKPYVDKIDIEFHYYDREDEDNPEVGAVLTWDYTRKEFNSIKKDYEKRIKPMFNCSDYKPSPGRHCNWCFDSKLKGGTCEY